MRTRRWTEEQLTEAVASSRSVGMVIEKLGLGRTGGNYESIGYHIKRLGLDTSHFKGQGWLKGETHTFTPGRDLEVVLVSGRKESRDNLKKRLLKAGILANQCAMQDCGISEWKGKALSLHLDHIDGDRLNHEVANLRLLCPNCHSLTETYSRGKINKEQARVLE